MQSNIRGTTMDDNNKSHRDKSRGARPARPPPSPAPQPPVLSCSVLLTKYNDMLDKYPLKTKMCTSFVVSAFGSALGSYLSSLDGKKSPNQVVGRSRQPRIDWVEVFSYAIHGGLINAPISHYWFEWLSAHGPDSETKSVLVDQLVVQPPLLVLMFTCLDVIRASLKAATSQFLEAGVVSKALSNAAPAVVASWRFWPFVVFFSFKKLKRKYWTVSLNLASVIWTVYLSRRGSIEE